MSLYFLPVFETRAVPFKSFLREQSLRKWYHADDDKKKLRVLTFELWQPWSSGYHYCTTSFNKAWTQVVRKFKSCSRRVGDLRWWGSLTMVPAANKAKRLSSVNHTTKTIHHHHHHHSHHRMSLIWTDMQNGFHSTGHYR